MAYSMGETFEYESPDGTVYKLSSGMRAILGFTGLGMPKIQYHTTRSPEQHGETVTGFRYQPRIVQLVLRDDLGDRFEYWEAREQLVDMLRPDRQQVNAFRPGKFRVIRPDGSIRMLYVVVDDGPSFSARTNEYWDEWGYTETLRFIAHDPIFWSETEQSFSVGPVEIPVATNLTFPITFRNPVTNPSGTGIQFYQGNILFNETANLTYNGSFETFPRIVITGPVDGPVVRNNTLNQELRFLFNVAADDTLTIYLTPGFKQAISAKYGDVTGVIADGGDLTTFRLAPNPEAPGGVNQIQFSGVNATDDVTNCVFHYYERYVGM